MPARRRANEDTDLTQFFDLGLAPKLLRSIGAAGLAEPTPIQARAIPLALEGRDVMGLAQTGTGKTLAFGLPLIQQLADEGGRPAPKTAKALVLAPTRELVNQIADSLRPFLRGTPVRVAKVVGGQSIGKQAATLSRGVDILVATPGRLIDLVERGAVRLGSVRQLVLDEADQMLDMGFIQPLRRIARELATPRRTMLFSATMPKAMAELSRAFLDDPVRVEVTPPGRAVERIAQSVRFVERADKLDALHDILVRGTGQGSEREDARPLSLVFARTKHGAEKLMKTLVARGFDAASIHGNKSQGQRDRAIRAFREGEVNVLVATDVAARGIDIPGVAHVVNYELPEVPQNYVHRIGRTARAGRSGEAISLCSTEELGLLRDIEKAMGTQVPSDEERPAMPGRGGKGRAGKDRGGKGRGPAARPGKARPGQAHPGQAHPGQARPPRRARGAFGEPRAFGEPGAFVEPGAGEAGPASARGPKRRSSRSGAGAEQRGTFGEARTGEARDGEGRFSEGRAGKGRPDNARPDNARPNDARTGKRRPGKAWAGKGKDAGGRSGEARRPASGDGEARPAGTRRTRRPRKPRAA